MLETIQCDICGRDYTIDNTLFSPRGTEYAVVRLADFENESVRTIKYNTCPKCTRNILGCIERRKRIFKGIE